MKTTTKKKESVSAPQEAKRGPVKAYRQNDVSAAIFAREHNGRTYHSWVLSRSYRDAGGSYKYTHTLNPEDAGAVASLAEQVTDYFRDLEKQEA